MKKILFILISLIVFTASSYSQNIEEMKRVSNAYGFLTGQQYALDMIKKKFPRMQLEIAKTELAFNSKFGQAKDRMQKYLAENFGEEKFREFNNTLVKQFKEMFPNMSITKDMAVSFLEEIKNRADGKIPTPVFETILHFQYMSMPEGEFSAGYKNVFRTKGHPKAKNTDWQIEIPKSWKAKEAVRPNIIQSFISNYGNGLEQIMIMTFDLGYKPSKREIERLLSEKEMKKALPANMKLLSFKNITIDRYFGAMYEAEMIQERIDVSLKMRMLQFSFIKSDKFYSVQCQIAGSKDEDLSLKMKKYLPLFKLVANSIVEFSQYQ